MTSKVFEKTYSALWADLDPNSHMRHTAYNDYAAQARVDYLNDIGFSMSMLKSLHLGPILLKEETEFYKEINLGEPFRVSVHLLGRDGEKKFWMEHHLMREEILCARIRVLVAFLDLKTRKMAPIPDGLLKKFAEEKDS